MLKIVVFTYFGQQSHTFFSISFYMVYKKKKTKFYLKTFILQKYKNAKISLKSTCQGDYDQF